MASIDELTTAIGAAGERIDHVGADIARSLSLAGELRDEFAGLGATDKTAAIESAERRLESGHRIAAAVAERAEQLLQRAAALRASTGGAARGGPAPAPSTQAASQPGGRPAGVPSTWTDSPAANGKGRVWQRPDSKRNADMLRLMQPNERYPNGYVRFYNHHGQPVGLDGKPGSRSETHIPIREDGTYDLPQGWHDDAA